MQAKWALLSAAVVVCAASASHSSDSLIDVSRSLSTSGFAHQVSRCPIHRMDRLSVGFFAKSSSCTDTREKLDRRAEDYDRFLLLRASKNELRNAVFVFGRNAKFEQNTLFGRNEVFR